jgi:DNA helicase-2/ATP-dependent DNA helicase PcrA
MKFIADLHIHSHFSRATSRDLTFEHLHKWAQLKGVQVVGTGDITHPGWLQEIKEKLEPAEEGLFRLKDEYANGMQPEVFKACQNPVRFILSGEISTIYKKNEQVRKIHHVVFVPTFEAVEKLQAALEKIGNIRSDGRPILGLDAHDLLGMILETDPQAYLIPAHIWTPWFSLFGSKSGFDTIEDCFEELTPYIFAVETGLSSDPPMNWRLSALDRYTLVSNSDAHSPQKLAREANLFDTELSYPAMFEALKTGNNFLGTIEFFPEEGKYHYDGHRKCGICWDPKTTLQHSGLCPVCGKKVTVGVMHRVETLADRAEGEKPAHTHPFHSLIPLPEVLAEGYGVNANSKRVTQSYEALLTQLGSELAILQDLPVEDIERVGGQLLAEGIRRMRCGEVIAEAGYDGEFGVIKLFEKQERESLTNQLGFFAAPESKGKPKRKKKQEASIIAENTDVIYPELSLRAERSNFVPPEGTQDQSTRLLRSARNESSGESDFAAIPGKENENRLPERKTIEDENAILTDLNPQQREAVLCTDASLIIVAGPGTGKTRTLTHRMAYLIAKKGVSPEHLLAITFTNKAAEEMVNRLTRLLGSTVVNRIIIKTFHAFCAMILREEGERIGLNPNFSICSEHDRQTLLKHCYPDLREKEVTQYLEAISTAKNHLLTPEDPPLPLPGRQGSDGENPPLTPPGRGKNDLEFITVYRNYEAALQKNHVVDFDDLILRTVELLKTSPDILQKYQNRFRWVSVDEYQDLNFAQYCLLKLLKSPEVNLCVIGDPDQAIYGFRGAHREYFLKFQEDFPDAKTLHLSQNYRSTQVILDASRQVIAKSSERLPLEIWSEFVSQTKLEIYHAPTYKAEAEYVVHEIEKMIGGTTYFSLDSGRVESHEEGTRSFGDFAVLYRLGAQSQPLFEAFQRSGIPYQIVGQMSLYEYKDIREILGYLWLLYSPESIFHLKIIKKPFGEIEPFLTELRGALNTQPVSQLIERIYEFTLGNYAQTKVCTPTQTKVCTPTQTKVCTPAESAERIKRLIVKAAPFEHRLKDFLETTVLQKETDEYDPRADRVTLMTLHASKGLEFPVVFIVGCEETLIPYQREGKSYDVEEERRLFYVGMTRAQEKLILTYTKTRFLFGQTLQNPPSRFLSDIENALKEVQKRMGRKTAKDKPDKPQLTLFDL